MKYIKAYETINQTDIPQVGDYLLDKVNPNRIGKITRYHKYDKYYTVDYLYKDVSYFVDVSWCSYWSPNKEDLVVFLNASKYNL